MIDINNFSKNNWELFCKENSIDYDELVKSVNFLNETIGKFTQKIISESKKQFLSEVEKNGKSNTRNN